jgi:RNA polymerase sigma-70 factor (ECF subfamily)
VSAANLPLAEAASADADLVRRVLAGERDAFSGLVRRHQAALYRHARGLGVEPDAAQDLVQDAFTKAYLRLRQCREPERFLSWLFRLFRNLVLDWLRDVRRREEPLESVGEAAAVDPGLDGRESREAVAGALTGLPGILREAFLLRHQQGCSYEEIAGITGASLSAAKMRVLRAREALRRALEPAGGEHVTGDAGRASSTSEAPWPTNGKES